jgi:hypothetical protein
MATRDKYAIELASTVTDLFNSGMVDPSAEEIAYAHFPGRYIPGDVIEGVRKRLARVRALVEEGYGLQVYPLSRRYYLQFRKSPPTTVDEGRLCLPTGRGYRMEGLRLVLDANTDFGWQAMIDHQINSGAGKMKANIDRTLDAVKTGSLENGRAAEILRHAAERAEPKNQMIADRVRKQLTEGEGDE